MSARLDKDYVFVEKGKAIIINPYGTELRVKAQIETIQRAGDIPIMVLENLTVRDYREIGRKNHTPLSFSSEVALRTGNWPETITLEKFVEIFPHLNE